MMKKLLILPLLLCSSPALADNTFFAGPYLGAQGGYSWNNVDNNAGADFDVDGSDYGVFLGFQIDELLNQTVGRMGMSLSGALEVHYNWSDASDDFAGATLEKDHDWGISFRPGLTFLDPYSPFGAKPYGIIGYRNANFEGSAGGVSSDENFDGFELGLGTEVLAYQKFGVRVDYSHVFYEDKGGFDPDEDSVRLGVAYHF